MVKRVDWAAFFRVAENTLPCLQQNRFIRICTSKGIRKTMEQEKLSSGQWKQWNSAFTALGEKLYHFRYLLAALLFVLCLIFCINGSSIGCWSDILGERDPWRFGPARSIQSDEWGMLTTMSIAQENNPAGAYSRYAPMVNGAMADQGIVYALPSKDGMTLFRPFHWGYLLFGSKIGLAWYWCGRFLALFLAVFELGMVITERKKMLSGFLAVCISFSPFLQWWYSVNGLVEMLIYGSCFLLGTNYLATGNLFWKRCLAAAGMALCAVGYVYTFYPAWMAPIAYSFFPIFLWILWKNKENFRRQWKTNAVGCLLPWLLFLLLFAAGIGYMLYSSWDTIQAVMHSAYPGRESSSAGGGGLYDLIKYPFSLFELRSPNIFIIGNSSTICFAPLGILLSLDVMIRNKKADLLLLFLLGIEIMLTWYYCLGFPPLLAKMLLLSFTTENRGFQVIGFLRLFILVRALSCRRTQTGRLQAGILAGLAAAFVFWREWAYLQYDQGSCHFHYWDKSWVIIATMLILTGVFYLLCRYHAQKRNLIVAALVAALPGTLINPVRMGVGKYERAPVYQAIRQMVKENPQAVWAELELAYPMSNLVALAGGICLTTSQTYPQLERWTVFGQDEATMEIYNRFCHIRASLGNQGEGGCSLIQKDYVQITLDDELLKQLGITYLLTPAIDLGQPYAEQGIQFVMEGQYGGFCIYRCAYETPEN